MDDEIWGCLVGGVVAVVVLAIIVWLLVHIIAIVGAVMGVTGVAYGGGQACKNYGLAFKHNVIDSNRT